MPLRYDYIKDLDEETKNNFKKAYFDTSNHLDRLFLPVSAVSPDGSDSLHIVEVSVNYFKNSNMPYIALRAIINNHGGNNIYIRCHSEELYWKYRDARFLVRNTDEVKVELLNLYVANSSYNLLLFAEDFRVKRNGVSQ